MHSLHDYMAANMETFLEGRMLDDLTPSLIKQLTEFVNKQQAEKFSVTRSTHMFDRAVQSYGEWLALQDIPQPVIRAVKSGIPKESPKLSPSGPNRKNLRLSDAGSIINNPTMDSLVPIQPLLPSEPSGDEVFLMDDTDANSTLASGATVNQRSSIWGDDIPSKSVPVWTRRSSIPRYWFTYLFGNSHSIFFAQGGHENYYGGS